MSRDKFWKGFLIYLLFLLAFAFLSDFVPGYNNETSNILTQIFSICLLIIFFIVSSIYLSFFARRFHDIGRKAKHLFLVVHLVQYATSSDIFVLCCNASNNYGERQKMI